MANKKIKLTPAGILFLIAIGVLMIALISVIVVLSTTCGGARDSRANPVESASPEATIESTELATFDPATDDPEAVPETTPSDDPESVSPTDDITGLPAIATPEPQTTSDTETGGIIITTPNVTVSPSPASTAKIYTSPTSAQKKKAKDGYVVKEDVNMRKGPATTYSIVKKGIDKNTSVTLYEQQGDWWFLKCGSSYGYIRKDMIKEGKAPSAKATATPKGSSSSYEGTIKVNSVAALRKAADSDSTCIKELTKDAKVTVYYKVKDSKGNYWYYVAAGKSKGYVYAKFVSTSKNVPTK